MKDTRCHYAYNINTKLRKLIVIESFNNFSYSSFSSLKHAKGDGGVGTFDVFVATTAFPGFLAFA